MTIAIFTSHRLPDRCLAGYQAKYKSAVRPCTTWNCSKAGKRTDPNRSHGDATRNGGPPFHNWHKRLKWALTSQSVNSRTLPKINLKIGTSNKAVIEFYHILDYSVDDAVSMGERLPHDDRKVSAK